MRDKHFRRAVVCYVGMIIINLVAHFLLPRETNGALVAGPATLGVEWATYVLITVGTLSVFVWGVSGDSADSKAANEADEEELARQVNEIFYQARTQGRG